MYAAAFYRADVQERIVRVYSNDGPGFNETVAAGREVLWNETKRTFERRETAEE